jgi:glycosyltransferase involved in cell wall biosynthesis
MHATKCNVETIEAFAPIARSHPSAALMFVGRDLGEGEAQARANALGLHDRVRFLGHVALGAFRDLAAVTDIGINLRRPPTNGETSGALLVLLSAGVPTIVIDVDTFASYPDDVVRKLRWNSELAPELSQALRQLATDVDDRIRLGEAALRYVRGNHSWAKSAALYAEVIEHAYLRQQLDRRLAG